MTDGIAAPDAVVITDQRTPQQTYERPASAFVSQFLGKTNDFAATVDRTRQLIEERPGNLAMRLKDVLELLPEDGQRRSRGEAHQLMMGEEAFTADWIAKHH